ncbi:MAG: glycosyltransferase [Pseudomonadota bacterium]
MSSAAKTTELAQGNRAIRQGLIDQAARHFARGLLDQGLPWPVRQQHSLNLRALVRRLPAKAEVDDNPEPLILTKDTASSSRITRLLPSDVRIRELVDRPEVDATDSERLIAREAGYGHKVATFTPFDLLTLIVTQSPSHLLVTDLTGIELLAVFLYRSFWSRPCVSLRPFDSDGDAILQETAPIWTSYASSVFTPLHCSTDLPAGLEFLADAPAVDGPVKDSSAVFRSLYLLNDANLDSDRIGLSLVQRLGPPWNTLTPFFEAAITMSEHREERLPAPVDRLANTVGLESTPKRVSPKLGSIDTYLHLLTIERLQARSSRPSAEPKPQPTEDSKHCEPVPLPKARPAIYWGTDRLQVVGKDLESYPYQDYLRIDQGHSLMLAHRAPRRPSDVIFVAMPSYNSERFLSEAIHSIVTQRGSFGIYLHIQDGGSQDGTLEIIERWQRRIQESPVERVNCNSVRLTYATGPDGGMYDAIQKAFANLAPPDEALCTWLNSDDLFVPGAFETAFRLFEGNTEVHWALGNISSCNERGEVNNDFFQLFPRAVIRRGLCDHRHWRFIQQEGTFWRSILWKAAGGINIKLKLAGDWDLWRRFAELTEPVHFGRATARFRIHGDQLSGHIAEYYREIDGVIPSSVREAGAIELAGDPEGSRTLTLVWAGDERKGHVTRQPLDSKFIHPTRARGTDPTKTLTTALTRAVGASPIKVLTINTIARGGAGMGSIRRINALRSIGVDARLLSLVAYSRDRHIGQLVAPLDALPPYNGAGSFEDRRRFRQHHSWVAILNKMQAKVNARGNFANEFFSTTDGLVDARQLMPLIAEFDVVHLHWIAGMFPIDSLGEALKGKPVVWTTADMNPFTGGCHYSEGCDHFMVDCANCPLLEDGSTLTRKAWLKKRHAYSQLDLTVVCPTEHQARLARRSSLFENAEIIAIPNAYPVDEFQVVEKAKARNALNLPPTVPLVAFGSDSLENPRKGADLLPKVVRRVVETLGQDFEVVAFGNGKPELPVKVHALGHSSAERLSLAYSAADVFLSLSREDVGPMTVIESMLCGTPVVGFPIGVLAEVGRHRSTTYLARPFDVGDVVRGIRWALGASEERVRERTADCRKEAEIYGDPSRSARLHRDLYARLLEDHLASKRQNVLSSVRR